MNSVLESRLDGVIKIVMNLEDSMENMQNDFLSKFEISQNHGKNEMNNTKKRPNEKVFHNLDAFRRKKI